MSYRREVGFVESGPILWRDRMSEMVVFCGNYLIGGSRFIPEKLVGHVWKEPTTLMSFMLLPFRLRTDYAVF